MNETVSISYTMLQQLLHDPHQDLSYSSFSTSPGAENKTICMPLPPTAI